MPLFRSPCGCFQRRALGARTASCAQRVGDDARRDLRVRRRRRDGPGVRDRGPHRSDRIDTPSSATPGAATQGAGADRGRRSRPASSSAGLANAARAWSSACCSGVDGRHHGGRAARLPVPGARCSSAPVQIGDRGAQRGAERRRRLAPRARRPRHARRRRRPRGRRGATCPPARSASRASTASRSPTRGGPPVLHDIDLEIAPRHRVAVVGETGSGKTTFAKLLTRLMDPTSGRGAARRRCPARGRRSPRCASAS